MRILFCNYDYPPMGGNGGIANALLAEELAARHDITVVTSSGPGLPRESIVAGVRVVRAPVFFRGKKSAASVPAQLVYLPMGVAAGKRLLETESFDVINTHFVMPAGPVGDTLGRFSDTPNVLSLYGTDLYDAGRRISPHRYSVLKAWVRRLAKRADRVVCQSGTAQSRLHQFYGADIECELIPLGARRQERNGQDSLTGHNDGNVPAETQALSIACCARLYEVLFDKVIAERSKSKVS